MTLQKPWHISLGFYAHKDMHSSEARREGYIVFKNVKNECLDCILHIIIFPFCVKKKKPSKKLMFNFLFPLFLYFGFASRLSTTLCWSHKGSIKHIEVFDCKVKKKKKFKEYECICKALTLYLRFIIALEKGSECTFFKSKLISDACVCQGVCVCVAWVFSWGLRFLPKHYLSAAAGWVAHILQSFSMEILQ